MFPLTILISFRGILISKTTTLLQLYLQPYLQGYPAFENFPALYHAISDFNTMLAGDIQPLFDMGDFGNLIPAIGAIIDNIERRLMDYTTAIGMIVQEFGNINPGPDDTFLQEVKQITGKFTLKVPSQKI